MLKRKSVLDQYLNYEILEQPISKLVLILETSSVKERLIPQLRVLEIIKDEILRKPNLFLLQI